jgi:Tol biopolymer transport system component
VGRGPRGAPLRPAGAALLGLFALVACRDARSASEAARRPPAPEASGAGARWDLAYERTANGRTHIRVIPAGGGAERALTDGRANEMLTRWTRDGRFAYFASDRTANWQIYRVRAEGGEPERLRANGATEWQVEPSPDGNTIAFLSNESGPESLYTMDLRTKTEKRLVQHGRRSILGNPSWSPEGGRLVFSSNWRIGHQVYLLDLRGGEPERLTGVGAGGCEPRFHPDGSHVLHVSRGHLSDKSRLVERDLRTGAVKVLVDWPALNYNPTYSPDATEIAFASTITGEYVVYRQRLSDGKAWRVTFGPGDAKYPEYRPRP